MKTSLDLIKNYIYVILLSLYFIIFYMNGWDNYLNFIRENILYWDIIVSYINWFVWFFLVVNIISIFSEILEKIFIKLFWYNDTDLDDIIWNFIIKFIDVSKYVAAVYMLFYIAITPKYVDKIVDQFSSILLLVIFLTFLTGFVNVIFQKELILKSKLKAVSRTLLPFINKIIVIFIWIIWVISILWNLWYDVSALIAWAWIWGLAIALAAQKSITNVFGAITILLNKPFKVWDYININNHIWEVKDIWLSYLTIIDKMWHQVMIPNEVIISTSVENYSERRNRRVDFVLWVVYWTSLDKMREWVKLIESILQRYDEEKTIDKYRVNFNMFSAYSLDISVTYFSLINKDFTDFLKQKEEINLEIKSEFAKAWLSMAFPTQELIMKKEV